MTPFVERVATFPRMFLGFVTTASGAAVTKAEMVATQTPAWIPIVVGLATIAAGLGTFSLCVLRWVVEFRKARKDHLL